MPSNVAAIQAQNIIDAAPVTVSSDAELLKAAKQQDLMAGLMDFTVGNQAAPQAAPKITKLPPVEEIPDV